MLDQRAARAREAEERRKAAKKRREEKEAKEAAARKQLGVGLATQLIGYSHTQAQLKSGMEAFLGLAKKKEEEKRRKELEFTKRFEEIMEKIEKEPWDDDDEDMAAELPELKPSLGEQWPDDDLDDDSLLEAHDLVMSDSVEEPPVAVQPCQAPVNHTALAPSIAPIPPKPIPAKDDPDFTRTHGPVNKVVEAILDKLPAPVIELLSQDVSLKIPDWDPALGLLHKLNPVGLPPHRLRLKVGCVVTLLRDLNTSSQVSKSQHLRVLRSENDRLECLVLDGQLEGTKTFLTRMPFSAKYKNLDRHPFQRLQFAIRVATDYAPSKVPRETSQVGFKLPSVPGRVPPAAFPKKPTLPITNAKPRANPIPEFKLPTLPASKSSSPDPSRDMSATKASSLMSSSVDCWDDFLESSTQISRQLASEGTAKVVESENASSVAPLTMANGLSPVSTQDLDFSLDDLDEEPEHAVSDAPKAPTKSIPAKTLPTYKQTEEVPTLPPARPILGPSKRENIAMTRTPARSSASMDSSRPVLSTKKIAGRCLNPGPFATGLDIELAKLRASQLPKSMSGHGAKRRATAAPSKVQGPTKRQCTVDLYPALSSTTATVTVAKFTFDDFLLSTQQVASFFDDDDI